MEKFNMQTFYLIAGVLALATGLVHSILGEIMIFRQLRRGGIVPATGAPPLQERNIRILWASWHALTLFGWACAGIFLWLAFPPHSHTLQFFVVSVIALANLGGSLLVLIGTRGRHPGWVALLAIAVLAWSAAKTGT